MSGDVQVRFCERPRVKFPRATHPVILFEYENDAKRVMEILPKRFERYGLTLHPDKTKLLPFKRPDRMPPRGDDEDKGGPSNGPLSFDFLGFTIHWAKGVSGKWAVRERTANDRFRKALRGIYEWCQLHRHDPLEEQQRVLSQKLRGHYGYYGRITNTGRLWDFLRVVIRAWWRALRRRSQRRLYWVEMYKLLRRYQLPRPARINLA